jgi:hypothetical protein
VKDYKIVINVSEVGGVYSVRDIEEAKEIAQSKCDEIYLQLRGRCRVEVESVEEVNKIDILKEKNHGIY